MKCIFQQYQILMHALMFFTRIPPIGLQYNQSYEQKIIRYFPFIGLIISGIQLFIYSLLSQFLPTSISIIIMMILSIMMTGAFHEDGLADSFDALWGGQTIEQRKKILKDSTLGTYGVISLILIFLLKIEVLKLFDQNIYRYLIAGNVLSRFFSSTLIYLQNYQGDKKSKSRVILSVSSLKNIFISLLFSSLIMVITLNINEILKSFICFIPIFIINHIIKNKMGFMRGDFIGSAQQIIEVTFYIIMILK